MQKILGYVRKACQEFDMIQDGDHIAVGVSGGKESFKRQMVLLSMPLPSCCLFFGSAEV